MARRKARGARDGGGAAATASVHTSTDENAPAPNQQAAAAAKPPQTKDKDKPSDGAVALETTTINGVSYNIQPEGLAKILLPVVQEGKTTEVFYNYIQKFNRDLTMAVTKGFGEVWEGERRNYLNKRKHRGGVKHRKVEEEDAEMVDVSATAAAAADTNAAAAITLEEEGVEKKKEKEEEEGEKKERFAVLDALSATGLRALRYAKEIPFVTHVTANDMSPAAVEYISRNIAFNDLSAVITPNHDNAVGHMYRTAYPSFIPSPTAGNPFRMKPSLPQKYHVIDLDPYGSATQFIDSAVQAVHDGGLLSVTCTDAAIFASTSYPEKTFACYGGSPAKGDYSHESGLRMVLMSIATTAAKYGLYIEPLLSLSIDYYCRLFVRVKKGPEMVKRLASKSMLLFTCDNGCGAWKVQELGTLKVRNEKRKNQGDIPSYKYGLSQAVESGRCDHCGFKMHIAGPMWADEIHSAGFVNHMLSNVVNQETVKGYDTIGRITGMLKLALGELMPEAPPTPLPSSEVQPARVGEPHTNITTTGDAPVDAPTLPTLKRKLKQREEATEEERSEHVTRPSRNPTADPLALFIMPTQLSRVLHCTAPSLSAFRGALIGLGYHVTKSHCRAGSVKTNAPWTAVWRVMRAWEKLHPVKAGSVTPAMAGYKILYPSESEDGKEEDFGDVDFDEAVGRDREKGKGEVMYQQNPGAYWGPMAKASKKGLTAEESSKLGNAEKDRRRREEKERREAERAANGITNGDFGKARKRRRGQHPEEDGAKGEASRESDGAQYGLAAISASDMDRLEEEAMKA